MYVRHNYAPVIEYCDPVTGLRDIEALPFNPKLLDNSFLSESLMASIATKVYDLGTPPYRIEREYNSRGVPISRQNMSNWLYNFADKNWFPYLGTLEDGAVEVPGTSN